MAVAEPSVKKQKLSGAGEEVAAQLAAGGLQQDSAADSDVDIKEEDDEEDEDEDSATSVIAQFQSEDVRLLSACDVGSPGQCLTL
jgi:hypothetical protein